MGALHAKQNALLKLLKKNVREPLSMKDLSEAVDIESPGVLYYHLEQLEKKGYLKRNPDNSKDYVVLDLPESSVTYISKYGLAECGPEGIFVDGNIVERIPISSSLLRFPASEAFIVEAKGNSMEPRIKGGDIVIARKQNYAEPGDVIICVYQGKARIKQYLVIGKRIVLQSFNEEHKLIEVRDELWIQGVVKNVLSY